MRKLKDTYKRFREWKQQPYQVAPLSEELHECPTCGTHYQGNYCPRCGQSAKIGRYSFKNAFLLFLDVWGLGNRGMFRSIRDLLLRPGYMIRDYLRGMQMAYFPPFKMFFLVSALSLLIDSGMNIQGINRQEQQEKESQELFKNVKPEKEQAEVQEIETPQKAGKATTTEEKRADEMFKRITDRTDKWVGQHMSEFTLICLLLFSLPLWLLFRHSPAIPDIRLSECFVTMVYITTMITIYSIVPSLLCFSLKAEIIYDLMSMLLIIVPIKQLSGYGYWSTIWRVALSVVTLIIILLSLLVITAIIVYSYYLA